MIILSTKSCVALFAIMTLSGNFQICTGQSGPLDDEFNYDYHYGDKSFDYDPEVLASSSREIREHHRAPTLDSDSRLADPVEETPGELHNSATAIPLCCQEKSLFVIDRNCTAPPGGWTWKPSLSGEPKASFRYTGFPKCKSHGPMAVYQKEVMFDKGDAFLPQYIQLDAVPPSRYCVVKVYDESDIEDCEDHRTKVFVCLEEKLPEPGIYWTLVTLAHGLLVVTLVVFFCVKDLQILQGQYMICFVVSLLAYNIFVIPLSVLTLDVTFASCVSLGAIKYFFFCGLILWFNVICFDVWRTIKCQKDISSRRRFIFYSLFAWITSSILTTAVLVIPYATGKENDDSLMENIRNMCKLKLDMNMILLLVELLLMTINLIFLILASANTCQYKKFGHGLLRCEANVCLKQGWKLYLIMVAHLLMDIPNDILEVGVVDRWRFVFLESLAIFAVFTYRRSVLRSTHQFFCRTQCYHPETDDDDNIESNRLTSAHKMASHNLPHSSVHQNGTSAY